MLPTLFVTFAALTLSTPPPRPSPSPRAAPAVRSLARPTAARALRTDDLYSLRARRRFAAYLRMRLLELREEGLERAADVIERRLPIDTLVPKPSPRP